MPDETQDREYIHVVIPTAVYDHGVVGVFTTQESAREHASALWRDSDGHHSYRIEEWPLDTGSSSRGPERYWGTTSSRTTRPPEIEVRPWTEADEQPRSGRR